MSYILYAGSVDSGTWLCPGGVTRCKVKCWGAGGGGGGGNSAAFGGGGGGGGAYAEALVTVVPGQTYTVTVGAKGNGASAGGDGEDGNDTEFVLGATVKCKAAPGTGGFQSGDPDVTGLPGTGGQVADCVGTTKEAGYDGREGVSGTGGKGGDAARNGTGGNGGTSGNTGQAGVAPGGGGGGGGKTSGGDTQGGDGADGKIYIEWYKDNEVVNIIVNA
jgi:hypothetical protein